MGLDMYLSARRSVYKPFREDAEESVIRKIAVDAATAIGLPASKNLDYVKIEREAAYWRKANQIHQWFVTNVQDGEDDCRTYDVEASKLQELVDLCKDVLDKRNDSYAIEKLPPQPGFFFGSTDVDEWYWRDLESTVEQIEPLLALPGVASYDIEFSYHASW